ncbi:DUF4032 domain-containing protein [Chloroflexales bacterium ZM16-3]|nr:DUF4032 domain-containing protein [Chloroflexales bacterium ZM16-3]
MSWITNTTREDFSRARRSAFIAQLLTIITRSSNDLLPFEEVRTRLNVRGQHYLGHQTVEIAHIIGSEGRYVDFDRSFAPRTEATRFRWMSIDRAHYEDVGLPAVDLYKLGDIYFVKDGHHRISVAHQRGQLEIDAIVTELTVDVPLTADLNMRSLLLKEEYSDFLGWTNFAEICPGQLIEFSEPGGYLDLVQHINAHRYYMGIELGRPVDRDDAVVNWYNEVYLPVIEVLREQQALDFFPGRTEADLYRWIMEHRWYLRERNGGADPGPLVAVADYVRLFGKRSLAALTERLMRGLRTMAGATAA